MTPALLEGTKIPSLSLDPSSSLDPPFYKAQEQGKSGNDENTETPAPSGLVLSDR